MPHALLRRSRGRVGVPLYWEDNRISDVKIGINMPFEGPEGNRGDNFIIEFYLNSVF